MEWDDQPSAPTSSGWADVKGLTGDDDGFDIESTPSNVAGSGRGTPAPTGEQEGHHPNSQSSEAHGAPASEVQPEADTARSENKSTWASRREAIGRLFKPLSDWALGPRETKSLEDADSVVASGNTARPDFFSALKETGSNIVSEGCSLFHSTASSSLKPLKTAYEDWELSQEDANKLSAIGGVATVAYLIALSAIGLGKDAWWAAREFPSQTASQGPVVVVMPAPLSLHEIVSRMSV